MSKFWTLIPLTALFGGTMSNIARAADEDIVTIDSRPNVTVGFVITRPTGATNAAAILFVGGAGKLKLWKNGRPRSRNFLFRSRHLFAARGVLTVTIDSPTDRREEGL